MSGNPAADPLEAAYLKRIDWVMPHLEEGLLWEAGRFHRRGLYGHMGEVARMAREGVDDVYVRRTSLILEGMALALRGDLTHAGERFVESRELVVTDPMVHVQIGVLFTRIGMWDQAGHNFEAAVQFNPDEGVAWAYLGIIRLLRKDWPGAREAALNALKLGSPATEAARLVLLNACAALGRTVDEEVGLFPRENEAELAPAPERFGVAAAAPNGAKAVVFCMLPAADLGLAEPMLWSLKAACPGWAAHLHLVNPGPEIGPRMEALAARAAPLSLGWSSEKLIAEDLAALRRRLRTARFERLRAFLKVNRSPVFLADPEVLFRGRPGRGLMPSTTRPVTLTHRPGTLVEGQLSGSLVGFLPGPGADAFLADATAACRSPLVRGGSDERLDQVALWAALARAPDPDRIGLLSPERALDESHGPSAFAWIPGAGEGEQEAYVGLKASLEAAESPSGPPEPEPLPANELLTSQYGTMLVNRNDVHISPAMRSKGGGEVLDEIELLKQFIGPGATVLDVGANIGTHTVPFCQLVGPTGKVLAFEPQRVIFQVMVANVALNSCLNAYPRQAAVGAEPGRVTIPSVDYTTPENFGMMSFIYPWDPKPSKAAPDEEVEMITLDSLALTACDLLKIDVEGMEEEVLVGGWCTLMAHRPVVYMECFRNDPGRAAMARLKSAGYRVFRHWVCGGENVLGLPVDRGWEVLGLEEL